MPGLEAMTGFPTRRCFSPFGWALWQMSLLQAGNANASATPHTGKTRIGESRKNVNLVFNLSASK